MRSAPYPVRVTEIDALIRLGLLQTEPEDAEGLQTAVLRLVYPHWIDTK
jgi:hypothetical protein